MMEPLLHISETLATASDCLLSHCSDAFSQPDHIQSQILPNNAFPDSPLPCDTAPGKNPTLDLSLSQGTDSGYSSLVPTPESMKRSEPRQFELPTEIQGPSRRLFSWKTTKLKPFDKPISEAARTRFRDLKIFFDRPLLKYVSKGHQQFTVISMKLTVLGEDEGSSKPYIVVLCDKAVSRRVRQFFHLPRIKQHYQTNGQDPLLPSFGLVVIGKPPVPMTTTNIVEVDKTKIDWPWDSQTLCGTPIRVRGQHGTRIGRIGGIIEISSKEMGSKFFGITVGHIVAPESSADILYFESPDEEIDPEEHDDAGQALFLEEDEEVEVDWGVQEDTKLRLHDSKSSSENTADPSTLASESWSRIGSISAEHSSAAGDDINLDWALIEFDESAICHHNLVKASSSFVTERLRGIDTSIYSRLKYVADQPLADAVTSTRAVIVITGVDETKEALLSTSPSFLCLAPGRRFADAYTLSMCHGSGMHCSTCR
jgi:hypothetical protein